MSNEHISCLHETSGQNLYSRLRSTHPFVVSAAIELTHRCNLRCPHCYLSPSIVSELSTNELKSVMDQLADHGTLLLTFTGGEIGVRPDFLELVDSALDRRFAVTLKTNGTSFSVDDVTHWAERGLLELNASLYHISPDLHDEFVGMSGAWKKTISNLRAFSRSGRKVQLSVIIMDWNVDSIVDLERMCEEEGWGFSSDFRIELRHDGNRTPCHYRLSHSKIVELVGISPSFQKKIELQQGIALSPKQTICGISKNLVIQPDGWVVPCVSLPQIRLGNVREKRLIEIWKDSKKLRDSLQVTWDMNPDCLSCQWLPDCRRCPATAYLEHGDLKKPASLDCELAEVWARGRKALEKRNG